MNQQLKPSEIVIMASGGAVFLLTLPFLHWLSFEGTSDGLSIWNTDVAFPLATYIPLIGLLLAAQVALAKFGNVTFPPQVIGFTWTQVHLVLSFFTVLIWLGFVILNPTGPGSSWGIAFWFSFLGSAGLMTGSIMELAEERKGVPPGPYPGGPGPYPGGPPPGPYPGPGQPPQQF